MIIKLLEVSFHVSFSNGKLQRLRSRASVCRSEDIESVPRTKLYVGQRVTLGIVPSFSGDSRRFGNGTCCRRHVAEAQYTLLCDSWPLDRQK